MKNEFDSPGLVEWLPTLGNERYDELEFGLVRLSQEGRVIAYNLAQSRITGVTSDYALGKHFFTEVAPCTNNFMVAEKYNEPTLDEILPYMFTVVTKPTRVKLRLIKDDKGNAYLLAITN